MYCYGMIQDIVEILLKFGKITITKYFEFQSYKILNMNSIRYKCLSCGRDKFTSKQPHNCIDGFRKRGIKWEEISLKINS